MTTTHVTSPPPRRRTNGLLITGAVLTALAVISLIGGGLIVGTHALKRDGHGFYAARPEVVTSPTSALVTRSIDIGPDTPGWLVHDGRLATIRVSATPPDGKRVFVGVAPRDRVDAYLASTRYDEVTDFEVDPFSVSTRPHAGTQAPARPAAQDIWSASATGTGRQTVEWKVRKGTWSVVVMNADGSPGISARIGVGVRTDLVLWVGL